MTTAPARTELRIAFLGLGAIGTPMARHLAASPFELTVWNRTAEKSRAFGAEFAARVADTPAEAARGADVVITCLPSSVEVESVLAGEHGLLVGLERGAVFVDCTSGDPAASRRIAEQVKKRGVEFLDAPVSGGVSGAEQARLTVMAGGDAAVLERVRPVLTVFGEKIVHCGVVGTGHALKSVNNGLLALHIWSTAEALATLARVGVSPDVALDTINASSGRSNASMNLFPERVLTGRFPRTFRLALLDKDSRIAAGVAREAGVDARLLALAAELFASAHDELGEEADHVEAVRLVERAAGVELRSAAQ